MDADDARADFEPARNARRRRIVLVTIAIVVVTLLLGSGALWASDLFGPDDGPAALADRATTTTTARHAGPAELTPIGPCQRSLTPDSPLRLWIAGDSLAGSLGPSLGKTTAATGVVQPIYDSRVSSGLGSPQFFDWPRHAKEEMARLDPEVVVFIIGTNDFRVPSPKPTDASGEPEWRAEYAQLVTEMLDAFEAGGSSVGERLVYWVGGPTMQDQKKDAGVRAVNEVARSVVAKHPRARYIDAYKLFAGEDGEFTATLPGEDGESIRVRAGDGIHLTPEGGDLLATRVYAPLDARCDLDGQAVPGKAKQVIKTKGSGEAAGGTRQGSGAQTTTPPTAAPAVAPPGGASTPATTPKTNGTTPKTTPQPPPPPPPPPPSSDTTSPSAPPDTSSGSTP
jgi:hypothetical protein